MKAAALSERVGLVTKTVAKDEYGQEVTTWAVTNTVWAEVSELRSRELIEASARQIEITTRFRMRYTAFNYNMRLRWQGQDYEPVQIIQMGRKVSLEILASRLDQNERDK